MKSFINILKVLLFSILIAVPLQTPASALSPEQRAVLDSGVGYFDIQESAECSDSSTAANNISNRVYIIGDSLTVGMNSTALGEDSLQGQLTKAGWNPYINAQGCRALYNSTNENGFQGDGNSCPNALITSAFNELPKDKDQIVSAGSIVIALGTNNYEGSEEIFKEKAIQYINELKALNTSIKNRIFWVNTHTSDNGLLLRSTSIGEIVQTTGIQLIDYRAAAIANPQTYTYPSNDVTHNDSSGYINKAKLIVSALGAPTTQSPSGGEYDPLSLTYPNFPDESSIVNGIETTIKRRYSQSPWIGKGQWILDQSKANNVNPLFVVSTGGVESSFGNSTWGRTNNNYFGIDQGRKSFSSPEEGILYFIQIIPQYLTGTGAGGVYKDVKNIYEYSSVHQAGSIVYPGEAFDPKDVDSKPGVTQDLYDSVMGVWVSWTTTDHPNNRYDGQLFNPLVYYRANISIINEITGLNIPNDPSLRGAVNVNGCGDSAKAAGANGWDLPGEGPNPMVYYSQLRSGDDPAVQGYYGNESYGSGSIAQCGCGPTSWSMIVSTLTGVTVLPQEVAEWAVDSGMQQPGCGSYWWWQDISTASQQKWGVRARQIALSDAANELRKGNLIMVSVGEGSVLLSPGGNGHLLVMRAVTADGKFLFADPSDGISKRNAYSVVRELGTSRTVLSADIVSNGLKALFVVERI